MAVGTVEMQAQGLGGLLKKVKKGVEAIAGQPQPEAQQSTAKKARGSETPVEGGGTITNPISPRLSTCSSWAPTARARRPTTVR